MHSTGKALPGTNSSRIWQEGEEVYRKWKEEVKGSKNRGIGVAWCHYGVGYGGGIPDIGSIILELGYDGKINIISGIVDYGQGLRSVILQIIEKRLGIKEDGVRITLGSTIYPDCGSTVSSRVSLVISNALSKAITSFKDLVNKCFGKGRLSSNGFEGEGGLSLSYAQLFEEAMKKGITMMVQARHRLRTDEIEDVTGQGKAYARYTFGLQIVDLNVIPDKGKVDINRISALYHIGNVLSPQKAYGQVIGGIAMGIGMALKEQFMVDSNGLPITTSINQHGYTQAFEMPDISVKFINEPLSKNYDDLVGVSGIGEPAILPTAPAIISAIEDACGILITNLPATPIKIRRVYRERKRT